MTKKADEAQVEAAAEKKREIDKFKWLVIAAIVGLMVKDCGGDILGYMRGRTLDYVTLPKAVQECQVKIEQLEKKVNKLEVENAGRNQN